ncbi:hypothetical protein DESUT3_27720 [Desulfuromonas versatilis]|uniref:Lipoprotein n=1 Tax=Desulfuromonas versatilis TaxID=2802975 RepID=A0ABN6E012_9BACT|nr:DUF995 domain-containing protein [Desulfuromonas versatilis]BCR05703.1 hypothetical protein DESUT3_27720 [Desulfuromonas versatilis]
MRSAKLLLPLAFALLLFGCALPAKKAPSKAAVALPAGTLKVDQVRALFAEKTVESVTGAGRLSQTYYLADGTLHQWQDGEIRTGTWRVNKKGRICLAMEGGKEKCRIIVKEPGGYAKYVVKKSGRHRRVVTYRSFKDGNPLGL